MRQAHHMTIDRALLIWLLRLAEPHGLMSDVKLQQLAFLAELQMFAKGFRGLHYEFFRFAYGAFSKELDNDLLALRRRERIENFSPSDKAEEVLAILEQGVKGVEANEKVAEILAAVVSAYGPKDSGQITQSVEAVEITTAGDVPVTLPIRDISFHTTLLVPHRIEVQGEFTLAPAVLARLNTALGY